jgi:transcription elongation factor Elf1
METMEKQVKQVCKCENCGNEAEMIVTCSIEPEEDANAQPQAATQPKKQKGTATCTNCGNEADMWVDVE